MCIEVIACNVSVVFWDTVYTWVTFTNQYNLVPATGQRCPAAGKVTIDQASRTGHVSQTYMQVLYPASAYWLQASAREMNIPPVVAQQSSWAIVLVTFYRLASPACDSTRGWPLTRVISVLTVVCSVPQYLSVACRCRTLRAASRMTWWWSVNCQSLHSDVVSSTARLDYNTMSPTAASSNHVSLSQTTRNRFQQTFWKWPSC